MWRATALPKTRATTISSGNCIPLRLSGYPLPQDHLFGGRYAQALERNVKRCLSECTLYIYRSDIATSSDLPFITERSKYMVLILTNRGLTWRRFLSMTSKLAERRNSETRHGILMYAITLILTTPTDMISDVKKMFWCDKTISFLPQDVFLDTRIFSYFKKIILVLKKIILASGFFFTLQRGHHLFQWSLLSTKSHAQGVLLKGFGKW